MESGYIYFVHADGTNRYKIGLTIDLDRRMKELNGKQSPFENRLLWSINVADMRSAEKDLHQHFVSHRVNGEWFKFQENELNSVEDAYDRVAGEYPVQKQYRHTQTYSPVSDYGDDDFNWIGIAVMGAIVAGTVIALGQGGQLPKPPNQTTQAVTRQRANVRKVPNGAIVCILPNKKRIDISAKPDSQGWFSTNACEESRGVIHRSVIEN